MVAVTLEFSPEPPSSGLLSDRAYEVIRESIISGTFKPGDQLVESQLARKLNISQAPVREALKKLSHEGLVTNIPRRGSFVTEVSDEEAAQAREVRVSLEELAARLATGRLSAGHAQQLRATVAEMRVAAKSRDIAAFRVHDTAFHRTVVEASGNTYLPRLWVLIEPSLQTLQLVSSPRYVGDWTTMAQAHADLITLLEGDDPELSARRFGVHARGKSFIGQADSAAS